MPNSICGNFGDEITLPILERLFSIRGIAVSTHRAELIGAGSILEHHYILKKAKEYKGIYKKIKVYFESSRTLYVWGSGTISPDFRISWPQELICCAVRGDLTNKRLNKKASVLGDPGILANHLIDRIVDKKCHVAIVPHYIDEEFASKLEIPTKWMVISPVQPVIRVVEGIASADLVLSSSLHGLITADSLGIPCVWLATNASLTGSPTHKFNDYASSRLRAFNAPISYEEALRLPLARLADLATIPNRDVAAWQAELIAAFPFR